MNKPIMNKIFWIDLEMTGLNPEKEVVIEVAAIITDLNFTELDQYHVVVQQPQSFLDQMDEWNTKTHTQTGLIKKVANGVHPHQVQEDLIHLSQKYFEKNKIIIAGNSIYQDRLFLKKQFPKFESTLNYRMLDVTSWKLIFQSKFGQQFSKQNTHKALDDIRESIKEVQFYLQSVHVTS